MSKISNIDNKILKNLFYTQIIDHTEGISSINLNNNIDNILLQKSKESLGDKCSKNGYILKDSIKIIKRSIGKIKSSHFNGMVNFNIKLEVSICNPSEGDIIECKVVGKNKMGILAKKNPLLIALSLLHHTDTITFNNVELDDNIRVEVIDSKFSLNDKEIQIIAKLYS
jgi:DNA-directed RNA polymerase subunit E'/Rpb7